MNYTEQEVSAIAQDAPRDWAGNVFSAALVLLAFFIIYSLSVAPRRRKRPKIADVRPRDLRAMGIPMITPKGVKGRKRR